MWEFLEDNKGKLSFKAGSRDVFAGPDSIHDPNPSRTKAIRKVVRLIIEKAKEKGIDAGITKQDIVTRYGKGRVLWKDERVAEWEERSGNMNLFGKLKEWEPDYKKLMGEE